MQKPILYSFRRCPYAIRARWAIIKSEISIEIREVSLKNKPQELINISKKSTVPVLILTDGSILDESIDIMKWAFKNGNDKEFLMEEFYKNKTNFDKLIHTNDEIFKYHLDRYKYSERYSRDQKYYHKLKAKEILLNYNHILSKNKYSNSITGGKQSLVDHCIWPFVRQYRLTDKEDFDTDSSLENLKLWLFKFLNDSIYEKVMIRLPEWKTGSIPIEYP